MRRDDALHLLKQHVGNEQLLKHMLATEAIMRALAERLGEDVELWGLAGLMHDIDYEECGDMGKHGLVGADLLENAGFDPRVVEAVRKHNYMIFPTEERKETTEIALVAADALTGLIVATALVMPDHRIGSVKVSTLRKKLGDKSFARGCDRRVMRECERIGLSIDDFLELGLGAMQMIAGELGL